MEKRDVVVVGAGPSGSAAAKKCAQYGLRTLMLEKRQLPRNKICSGMIMGPVQHNQITPGIAFPKKSADLSDDITRLMAAVPQERHDLFLM